MILPTVVAGILLHFKCTAAMPGVNSTVVKEGKKLKLVAGLSNYRIMYR